MKKFILFILVASLMQAVKSQDNFCDPATADEVNNFNNQDGAVWLKDFNIYTVKGNDVKYTMVLKQGSTYRFVVKNSPKYSSKMKINITDDKGKEVLSACTDNYNPKAYDIYANGTGAYKLKFTFPDGEEGCGAVAIFFVKNL